MTEKKIEYSIESRKSWEHPWVIHVRDSFGAKALQAITHDKQEAINAMSKLRDRARTYCSKTEYRLTQATTTYEVLDE